VMRLNDLGHRVQSCWDAIPTHFPCVRLDSFVVMPNHVHGIFWIMETARRADALVGANDHLPLRLPRSKSFPMGHGTSKTVGSIVRGFKIGVTRFTRQKIPGIPV
jgi:putative transposase